MPEITQELAWLDELGELLIQTGTALETDPEAWSVLWERPELRALAYLDVPSRHNPHRYGPLVQCPYHQHLALIEYLSRFDASALMALPGPSLSTHAVLSLGTEAQIERFFARFHSSPQWSFFAVTEPEVGSDASHVRSLLTPRGSEFCLNAVKILIGSAQRASVGLLLARTDGADQPCLLMLEPQRHPHEIVIEPLATVGLSGAGLCRLEIRDLPVSRDQILGSVPGGLRFALEAITVVFERHRPMVAAMAMGSAYSLIDALERAGAVPETLATLRLQHEVLLRRMMAVAQGCQQGLLRGREASLLKLQAVQFVERVARSVPVLLSPEALLSSSLMRRRYHDAFAFEYMEGTSHIHLLNTYRAYVASRRS